MPQSPHHDLPYPTGSRLGVPSRGMARISTLRSLLAPAQVVEGGRACRHQPLDALLCWGLKPSGRRAVQLAQARGIPLWRCEDGFLRSIGLGPEGPPLSLVVDDQGIYYDASAPSRLEALIGQPLAPGPRDRAEALLRLWCEQRVSKYNGAPESQPPGEPYVLVVDQTAADLSIQAGLADASSFSRMLAAALCDHPDHRVVLKVHPDVAAGRKRGHFSAAQLANPRLLVIHDGGHPTALIESAAAVYVVTSQLGFEALLWRRPVYCFGMPFYAGWGLSHDHLPPPSRRRGRQPDLAQLVHAALVAYPRYLDPHRGELCSPERLIQVLGLQRRQRQGLPECVEAFGFKPWKQPILRRFLAGSRLRFRRRHSRPTAAAGALAIWGRDPGRGVQRRRQAGDSPPLLRIEDGFLRSVGLGANLVAPVSWVVDRRGIYYDASCPSDLEWYLAHHGFTDAERQRAALLRRRLVDAGLTKYNLTALPWRRPPGAVRVVLVPGQVESDASIRYGASAIRTNLALLEAVRRAEPEAWILYKPHPDVVAGLRQDSSAGPSALAAHCDQVVTAAAMDQLLEEVDALHVLTSLAGFEALLRGVPVHTWGLPFYAGWGLTRDQLACGRRGRRLSLDELVYGALVAYPRYVSRHSGWALEPEEAVEELLAWRQEPTGRLAWWQHLFRHWGRTAERIRFDPFRGRGI